MASVFRYILLAFLCGCSLDSGDPAYGSVGPYQVQGPGYTFIVDSGRFQRMDFNRKDPTICKVKYEVRNIKRNGNELTIGISRPKGCNGFYELVWDGVWQESDPRRMQMYLTGMFNSCTAEAGIEWDVIKVDLSKAIQEVPKDLFTIYLREHCSFRDFNCVGNCELVIPD